jgi:hypothetical protein
MHFSNPIKATQQWRLPPALRMQEMSSSPSEYDLDVFSFSQRADTCHS